ncbi:MAG: hypothetical protein HQ508_04225 [Candidatus Marinimicrobia bacterium]|nr:hypothetical protein [Candidatus Neomarinimicrobiota bacterium]
MQDFIDLLMSNKLYLIGAGIIGIGLLIFLMKKVFKLVMIGVVILLAYVAFLYATQDDPMKYIKDKLSLGKSTMDKIDDASQGLRQEALDKIIKDVDKKLNKGSKKK